MNPAERELLEAIARWERAAPAAAQGPEAERGDGAGLEALALALGSGAARGGVASYDGGTLALSGAAAQDADALRDLDALRGRAEELAARGLLRRIVAGEKAADAYALTEDGRLALAGPLDLTLYTRPGCHLCEEAKAQIAPLVRSAGARLREVNIDADALLRQRYAIDIPVLFLGDRKVAKHRVDLRQFQRQLEEASRGGRR